MAVMISTDQKGLRIWPTLTKKSRRKGLRLRKARTEEELEIDAMRE